MAITRIDVSYAGSESHAFFLAQPLSSDAVAFYLSRGA